MPLDLNYANGAGAEYVRSLLNGEEGLLRRIRDYAQARGVPSLLPETANLLRLFVSVLKPKNALEIGSGVGYSAALALLSGAENVCGIEIDGDNAAKAKEFLTDGGLNGRAAFFCGDAGGILPLIDGQFDFILLDGPKSKYAEYLPYLCKLLISGGVLFCDNVLFKGLVSGEREEVKKKNSIVRGLDGFLKELCADGRFITSVLTVGDGVAIAYKK